MKKLFFIVVIAAAVGGWLNVGLHAQPQQPTVQLQSMQQALGGLTMQNIVCTDQVNAQAEELRKVKAELGQTQDKLASREADIAALKTKTEPAK